MALASLSVLLKVSCHTCLSASLNYYTTGRLLGIWARRPPGQAAAAAMPLPLLLRFPLSQRYAAFDAFASLLPLSPFFLCCYIHCYVSFLISFLFVTLFWLLILSRLFCCWRRCFAVCFLLLSSFAFLSYISCLEAFLLLSSIFHLFVFSSYCIFLLPSFLHICFHCLLHYCCLL